MIRDEPSLRPGLYRMPERPIGPRILIPAFRQATSIRGAFGWFSSGWISRLAPGLAVYLARDDAAPMHFTISPEIFPHELDAVRDSASLTADEAAERVRGVFVEGRATSDVLARHALDCLTWMLATQRLVLRIAVPHPWSNYHPKLWSFDDGVDQVVVRGSGNATSKGVFGGVEHMDVDVSWDRYSGDRLRESISMLADWERGRSMGIQAVYDLPEAIEREILTMAPDIQPTYKDYLQVCALAGNPIFAVTADMIPPTHTRPIRGAQRLVIPNSLDWVNPPYQHQAEAVSAWENANPEKPGDKPELGVLAMATGAGKTLTSLICATRVQDRRDGRPLLVVVAAPSTPLVRQWKNEIAAFGVAATTPTLDSNGTTFALTQAFRRLLAGGTHVLVVTNQLLCTPEFQSGVRNAAAESGAGLMLVADEAHTLGAEGFLANQPDFFDLRLGLSATPERQFDPDGTETLLAYFGGTVYEFGLARAIGFCLVPYRYHVHATTLNGEELSEFVELSNRIGAQIGGGASIRDEALTRLLIQRRRIVETAEAKIELVRAVLMRRGPRKLKHALVYASSKNPEQFDALRDLLNELGIVFAEVTERQTGNASALASIFSGFERGDFQVLLAKRVLDEGVDIPSIREAFLVASSTVEREWIQRRGRILRRSPGKNHAILHDFLALPPVSYIQATNATSIRAVVGNELGRATTFATHAANAAGRDGVLEHIAELRNSYWPKSGAVSAVLKNGGDKVIAPDTPAGELT